MIMPHIARSAFTKLSLCFGILTVCIILFTVVVQAASIGISPGKIVYNDVLKGGYAEQVIRVTSNAGEPVIASYQASGDVASWIRLSTNTSEFTIPPSGPAPLTIIVEPPADLPSGKYSGALTFTTVSSTGEIEGRAGGYIQAAVTILVEVMVTGDEIRSCIAGGMNVADNEVGNPLDVTFIVRNNGNVRITPKVDVQVWDQLQKQVMLSSQVSGDLLLPTQERTMLKSMSSTGLLPAQYWADIKLPECSAHQIVTFSIVEKGGISDIGIFEALEVKPWSNVGETIPLIARFRNSGPRTVSAKIQGNILLDNTVAQVLETEEIRVEPGDVAELTSYFSPKQPGRYLASARILYNSKLTETRDAVLNVKPGELESGISLWPLFIFIVILVSIFVVARKIIRERRGFVRRKW